MPQPSLTTILVSIALVSTWLTTSRCAEGFVAGSSAGSMPLVTPPLQPAFISVRGGTDASSSFSLSETSSPTESGKVPSWDALESELEELRKSLGEEEKPVLTLYRDTNGWCPFCERVWVAIRAKGLPYEETLINLQNKPEWYKQMVPTNLVPAVLFHGNEDDTKASTSRELVWESDAILEALDAKFPDTIQLMKKDDKAFDDAVEMFGRVQAAGVKLAYGNRNGTATDEEIRKIRDDFESALNDLDAALGEQASLVGTEKCFRLGTEFSGVDAMMIPTLERWRYQLPFSQNMDILENRNNLRNWFETMDSYEPFASRVAGDEYSWTATASMFLRFFGGGEDKPKVAAGIALADAAAEKIASDFVSAGAQGSNQQKAAFEAAAKLISNHEAVLVDCTKEEPLTQKHIARAPPTGTDAADLLLRHVSSVLLKTAASSSSSISDASVTDLLDGYGSDATAQGALALQTVSKRLSVPRDMGAPSAALLRGVLSRVAENLLVEGEGAKAVEAVAS